MCNGSVEIDPLWLYQGDDVFGPVVRGVMQPDSMAVRRSKSIRNSAGFGLCVREILMFS